jgi:hypothetical protein
LRKAFARQRLKTSVFSIDRCVRFGDQPFGLLLGAESAKKSSNVDLPFKIKANDYE